MTSGQAWLLIVELSVLDVVLCAMAVAALFRRNGNGK